VNAKPNQSHERGFLLMKLRRITIIATLLFTLLFASFSSFGQETIKIEDLTELLREGEPAFTAEEAHAMMLEVLPLVEEVAGRKFKQVPELVIADRDQMVQLLVLESLVRSLSSSESSSEIAEQNGYYGIDAETTAHATGILGKCGLVDNKLYLMPRNFFPLMQLCGVGAEHTIPLTKLVIAHELTHVLQNQEVGLMEFYSETDLEKLYAISATYEGHAVFVHDQVGKILGIDHTVIEMSRMLSAGEITFEDYLSEAVKQKVSTLYEKIYLGGRDFIEFHFQRGGNELVWEILANPPLSTAMILEPATYSPLAGGTPNYAALLKGLETFFDLDNWQIQNTELGRMMIEASYMGLSDEDQQAIIPNIEHVQAFIAQKPFPIALINVSFIKLADSAIAPRYIGALEQLEKDQIEALNASGGAVRITGLTMDDFTAIDADLARKTTYRLVLASDEEPAADAADEAGDTEMADGAEADGDSNMTTIFRICRGDVVIEIICSGIAVDDTQIALLAEEVFVRYAKMQAAEASH
jgi:hypothetical protein